MATITILFYIDPTLSCLKSIQLTRMRLFFRIKKLQVDLLPKPLKLAIFQYKNDQKIGLEWQKFLPVMHLFF